MYGYDIQLSDEESATFKPLNDELIVIGVLQNDTPSKRSMMSISPQTQLNLFTMPPLP
jgi:hypothetical protein